MPSGISNQRRNDLLLWITGQTVTAPGSATLEVALSTADPGDAAASLAEVGGGVGYTRGTIASSTTGWNTPTASAGSPTTITNKVAITFGTATGAGWGTITHVAIFTGTAQTSAATFVLRAALATGQAISAGTTVSIAIGGLVVSCTFT